MRLESSRLAAGAACRSGMRVGADEARRSCVKLPKPREQGDTGADDADTGIYHAPPRGARTE